MAKFGMGGGMPAMGGAPMTSPRPMARPEAAGMAGGGFLPSGNGGGGLFGNIDAQSRYDMTMAMLQNGMTAAQSSGSPVAAFLAPLAGAMIGGRATSNLADAKASATDGLAESMLGGRSPEVQQYADVLENPNAPDYLKSIAKTRLEDALKPVKAAGSKGGGRSSSRGGSSSGRATPRTTDALLASMFSEAYDPNGDGGAEMTPAEQAKIDAIRNARGRSNSASITYGRNDVTDPLGMNTAPGAPDNDPLGLR